MRKKREAKYYKFKTSEEMNKLIDMVEREGYQKIGTKKASFKEVQKAYSRNNVYLLETFYNHINGKKEYQFSTEQVLKSYGVTNIKFSNVK